MIIGLKKAFSLLKNYWYLPVIVIAIVVLTIASGGTVPKHLIAAFQKARDTHSKEVDVLNDTHREEIKKRDASLYTYHLRMLAIEKKYTDANEKLDSRKRKQIEKLIKDNAEDPTELTKRIAEETGFIVVMPGE